VEVHRLVERFDRQGKAFMPQGGNGEEHRKSIIDCEQDIRGIVKKVVKFFNEFAERNIQSKQKKIYLKERKRLKVRLKAKLKESSSAIAEIHSAPSQHEPTSQNENGARQMTLYQEKDPLLQWRDSIRLRVPEWSLLSRLGPSSEYFLSQRYKLRTQIPGESVYARRDFFKQLPDHILVNIFSRLPRDSLAALKLACRDFVWLIEAFDIIAEDSGWRKGIQFFEDRCKVCKRKRNRGDSSLCRSHPKQFYGDPCSMSQCFYMCCHAPNRTAPGCLVLKKHDNDHQTPP